MTEADRISQNIGTLLGVAWVFSGYAGLFLLLVKGKLQWGVLFWLFVSWWFLPIIGAVAGFVLFVIGIKARAEVTCPFCRRKVHPDATRCPHCQSELRPGGLANTAVAPDPASTPASPPSP